MIEPVSIMRTSLACGYSTAKEIITDSSTILSKVISISAPQEELVPVFLAIAPSTASSSPDIQSTAVAMRGSPKSIQPPLDIPSTKAKTVTLFAEIFLFIKPFATLSIIGSTYFLP